MQRLELERLLLKVVGPTTARQYAGYVLEACEVLEREDLVGSSLQDLRRYLAHPRVQRLSPASITRRVSALRAYWRVCMRMRVTRENPAVRLSRPRLPDLLPRWLPAPQIGAVLDALSSNCSAQRDRALLELAYSSGLRLAELLALRLEDLDLSDGWVEVHRDHRSVPVGPRARQALRAYLHQRRDAQSPVFFSLHGRPLSPRGARWVVRQLALAAGLPQLTLRVLRNSCGAHLLDAGADLRYVQAMLGHRDGKTTLRLERLCILTLIAAHRRYHPRA